ncbi:MAG TPA: ESX secretion-associated protein EspG [Micromonosporaceae bacterium]|nr:ESX secretion-associated protein EspG [Micromonosporaceae bacterium]
MRPCRRTRTRTRKADGGTVGQTITLSALEYDVLWEHLQLGPFPPILEINSHGATLDERAQLTANVWESLAERELGWPNALDTRLQYRLRLLARPEWELDARLQLSATGPRTSALIAANHITATVAVLDAGRLTLRTVPADTITQQAVALLPPHPPGTGNSITLPADTLDAAAARAGSDPHAFAQALRQKGLGKSEAHKIADVAGNVIRFGHFGAARTPRFEKRRRANHIVSVYDTNQARYLFTRKPSSGRHWVTLVPGTEAAITRQLDELLGQLRQ